MLSAASRLKNGVQAGWNPARLLNHTGRKSGQPRQTVLEVIRYDKETGAHIIASGFGEKANAGIIPILAFTPLTGEV